jgi:predicted nucleic acid-binding Zn ribbon protein
MRKEYARICSKHLKLLPAHTVHCPECGKATEVLSRDDTPRIDGFAHDAGIKVKGEQ